MAISLLDLMGISSYCKLLHQTPWGMERCMQAGDGQTGSFVCYAGLQDYAMAVHLPNGDRAGTIFCGQVTNEKSQAHLILLLCPMIWGLLRLICRMDI